MDSENKRTYHKIFFVIFLLTFVSLTLFYLHRSLDTSGGVVSESEAIEERKTEFYEGLEESGIEPHPAKYWEGYDETESIEDEQG